MTISRSQKLETNFRNAVHEEVEKLLRLLAPDELIVWGPLSYKNMLNYLRRKIEQELVEIEAKDEEST